MVIDTSPIVAIAFNEPEAESFEHRIADAPVRLISAATVLEAAMVIETRLGSGPVLTSALGRFLPSQKVAGNGRTRRLADIAGRDRERRRWDAKRS